MSEREFRGPFFHGSYDHFPMGLRFRGRGDEYHEEWRVLDHYEALHRHAPEGAIHHRDAVFMCDKIDDIDLCGGATETVILLRPVGNVTRHDFDWTGHISLLLDRGASVDDPAVRDACLAYWAGTPMSDGDVVWEYLTTEAEVVACGDYEDPEVEDVLMEFWRDEGEMGMSP